MITKYAGKEQHKDMSKKGPKMKTNIFKTYRKAYHTQTAKKQKCGEKLEEATGKDTWTIEVKSKKEVQHTFHKEPCKQEEGVKYLKVLKEKKSPTKIISLKP